MDRNSRKNAPPAGGMSGVGEPVDERWLQQAGALFAAKGYRQCGVQEIIDRLGMSKGGFYWHFKSKEDLYVRTCRWHCERNRQAFAWLLSASVVDGAAVETAARRLLEQYLDNPAEIRLMLDFQHECQAPGVREALQALGQELEDALTALAERCQAQGALQTADAPRLSARLCIMVFRGVVYDFDIRQDRESAMSLWVMFVRNLFRQA